jgi:translation initiation factor 3 subunit A
MLNGPQLSRDVLKLSPPSIKSLYDILEVTFDPLTLCSSIAPLLITLSEDPAYAPYRALLQRALLSRLLSQLSQVYTTIKISQILSLVAPLRQAGLEGAFDEEQIEAYIMGCARRGELNIRVDHAEGSIAFCDDAFVSAEESTSVPVAVRENAVQPSTAELVRTRLSKLAESLHNSLNAIYPPTSSHFSTTEQQAKFASLVSAADAERRALQLRRALVARRRELLSELSVRKEKEEASRRAETNRREKDEEARKQKEDARRREIEKTRKEIEAIRIQEALTFAKTLKETGRLNVTLDVCSFYTAVLCSYLHPRAGYGESQHGRSDEASSRAA